MSFSKRIEFFDIMKNPRSLGGTLAVTANQRDDRAMKHIMNSSNSIQPSPKILLTHFQWTVDRFEEILKNEKSDYYRDAALQRFTFTCNTALKLIRSLAAERGEYPTALRQGFQWAVENKWAPEDALWNKMEASFNLAARKLKDEEAGREYEKLASYCLLMKNLCVSLSGAADR